MFSKNILNWGIRLARVCTRWQIIWKKFQQKKSIETINVVWANCVSRERTRRRRRRRREEGGEKAMKIGEIFSFWSLFNLGLFNRFLHELYFKRGNYVAATLNMAKIYFKSDDSLRILSHFEISSATMTIGAFEQFYALSVCVLARVLKCLLTRHNRCNSNVQRKKNVYGFLPFCL